MATDRHRFSISLDEQTFQIYKRFAELSEKPLATIVSTMLEEAREHFIQLGVMLQQAQALKGQTAEQQAAFLARLQASSNRAQAVSDLVGVDLVQMAQMGAADTRVAAKPLKRVSAAQSLIHRNKVPKPRPATVPAVSSKKAKGSKRAPT